MTAYPRAGSAPAAISRGFTLMELLVAMAIVGILSAIAIPAYRSYALKGNRTDAIRALTSARQALERCYSQNFTYVGCPAATNFVGSTPQGDYQIALPSKQLSATGYQLTATTTGAQQSDKACSVFTISQNGTQTATDASGNVTTQSCWGSVN